jgi:hypothetical protein
MTYAELTRTKCPLPIAAKAMPAALINLYQRLLGEVDKAKRGEAPLVDTAEALVILEAIRTVMGFVRPDIELAAVDPIRTRIRANVFHHGGLRSNILAVLRTKRDWMTVEELVEALLRRSRKALSVDERRRFKQKVREACFELRKRRYVEPEHVCIEHRRGESIPSQRWRLGPAFLQ